MIGHGGGWLFSSSRSGLWVVGGLSLHLGG